MVATSSRRAATCSPSDVPACTAVVRVGPLDDRCRVRGPGSSSRDRRPRPRRASGNYKGRSPPPGCSRCRPSVTLHRPVRIDRGAGRRGGRCRGQQRARLQPFQVQPAEPRLPAVLEPLGPATPAARPWGRILRRSRTHKLVPSIVDRSRRTATIVMIRFDCPDCVECGVEIKFNESRKHAG